MSRPPTPGRRRARAPKKIKPQSQWATLYMTVNADQIIVGDVFSVDVHLWNPKKIGFNRLSAVIQYDPVFLMPIKGPVKSEGESPQPALALIDMATFAPSPKGVAAVGAKKPEPYIWEAFAAKDKVSLHQSEIDQERGVLTYMFELSDETCTAQGRVASVYFKALQPTQRTQLSFHFAKPSAESSKGTSELGTSICRGDVDCLGLPLRPDDGTIDRGITILSEKPTKNRVRSFERQASREEIYQTHLSLLPQQNRVVVGDQFNVYVELENPEHVRFDQISLLIAYNPRVLEAVDYDSDNAITRGVNIHDGSYRDTFPFDFFATNRVDTDKGLIDYRMRGYKRPLHSEGVLACIRFRALKSTSKTTLRIFLDRKGEDPTTGLFYRFHDVLGDSEDPTDGVSTCSVEIGRLRSAAVSSQKKETGGG